MDQACKTKKDQACKLYKIQGVKAVENSKKTVENSKKTDFRISKLDSQIIKRLKVPVQNWLNLFLMRPSDYFFLYFPNPLATYWSGESQRSDSGLKALLNAIPAHTTSFNTEW